MAFSLRLLVVTSLIACAIGGYPKSTTIFRDWKTYDARFDSFNQMYTEIWKYTHEFEIEGVYVGARLETRWNQTTGPTFDEYISVQIVQHNGTYGAPRQLIGGGSFQGVSEFGGQIYIPITDTFGVGPAKVLPYSFENTLYYFEIIWRSPTTGWYPYFFERDLDYFGSVLHESSPLGFILGLEFSKPSIVPTD